jgi:hypothetical protein
VVLSWLGGLCDRDATVRFHVVHGDYLLNVAIHDSGGSCPAAGVPRAIRIALSRSIPVESIVVAGGLLDALVARDPADALAVQVKPVGVP